MKRQNHTKRTIISFSLAFATALLTLFIQNINEKGTLDEKKLEAKVYPKSSFLLKK